MWSWDHQRRRDGDASLAREGWRTTVRIVGVVALLLGMAAALLAPSGEARAASGATIATDVLNLRTEPGTWGAVITRMWQDEWVEVLAGPTDDGWYKISYHGEWGWAYGGYLALDGAGGTTSWAPATSSSWAFGGAYTAWVNTDQLAVRASASHDAVWMDTLWYGDALTITGAAVNGFLPIDHWRGWGWVYAGSLNFDRAPGPERWIDVDRGSQLVTLYEGGAPIVAYWGAMGFDGSADGFYATANGSYRVYSKHEPLSWTPWAGAFITHWVGFDPWRSNGFHSYTKDWQGYELPWGAGATGGCVGLAPWAAAAVYDFAAIGMRVEVHW